jgi:hypothetical protein
VHGRLPQPPTVRAAPDADCAAARPEPFRTNAWVRQVFDELLGQLRVPVGETVPGSRSPWCAPARSGAPLVPADAASRLRIAVQRLRCGGPWPPAVRARPTAPVDAVGFEIPECQAWIGFILDEVPDEFGVPVSEALSRCRTCGSGCASTGRATRTARAQAGAIGHPRFPLVAAVGTSPESPVIAGRREFGRCDRGTTHDFDHLLRHPGEVGQEAALPDSSAEPPPAKVRTCQSRCSRLGAGRRQLDDGPVGLQSSDDCRCPQPWIVLDSACEHDLLLGLRSNGRKTPDDFGAYPHIALAGETLEFAEVTGSGLGVAVPSAGIQVAEEVGLDDEQVEVVGRCTIRSASTHAHPHFEARSQLDEFRHLVFETAGPQAGQAGRALRQVLRPLPRRRLPGMSLLAFPEDPIVGAARRAAGIAIRPGRFALNSRTRSSEISARNGDVAGRVRALSAAPRAAQAGQPDPRFVRLATEVTHSSPQSRHCHRQRAPLPTRRSSAP